MKYRKGDGRAGGGRRGSVKPNGPLPVRPSYNRKGSGKDLLHPNGTVECLNCHEVAGRPSPQQLAEAQRKWDNKPVDAIWRCGCSANQLGFCTGHWCWGAKPPKSNVTRNQSGNNFNLNSSHILNMLKRKDIHNALTRQDINTAYISKLIPGAEDYYNKIYYDPQVIGEARNAWNSSKDWNDAAIKFSQYLNGINSGGRGLGGQIPGDDNDAFGVGCSCYCHYSASCCRWCIVLAIIIIIIIL